MKEAHTKTDGGSPRKMGSFVVTKKPVRNSVPASGEHRFRSGNVIAETPPGEQIQYETRLIGSVDDVTKEANRAKAEPQR